MNKTQICVLVAAIIGSAAAVAATTSESTLKVVGFKPEYKIKADQQPVSGILMVGSKLSIDHHKLDYFDLDGDLEDTSAVTYSWKLGDTVIPTIDLTIPAEAEGKNLQLLITPSAKTGDPKLGKVLVISDLKAAGASGGGDGGVVIKPEPSITNLVIQPDEYIQPGAKLTATYIYHANGSADEGKSKYKWGLKGKTSNLEGAGEISKPTEVPGYMIKRADIGEVLEVSVQPKDKIGRTGPVVTTAMNMPVVNSTPEKVEITFTESTVQTSGIVGHPLINKEMGVIITHKNGAVVSKDPKYYDFQWKVGVVVDDKITGNVFTANASQQGKQVSVTVLPKN